MTKQKLEVVFWKMGHTKSKTPTIYIKEGNIFYPAVYLRKAKNIKDKDYNTIINNIKI